MCSYLVSDPFLLSFILNADPPFVLNGTSSPRNAMSRIQQRSRNLRWDAERAVRRLEEANRLMVSS